jgi:ankyrin repeat protein
MWSILTNDLAAVRAHLAAGVDPNKSDKRGLTPLIRAAGAGSLPIVQLLIEKGADVNHADIDGFTSLMCAAGAGHADIVRFLIRRGAQVDRTDDSARTALSWAVTKEDVVDAVKALVELGADLNHLDGTGVTPLMRAALLKFPYCFRALLAAGANPFVIHLPSQKTALDMATESGNSALMDAVHKLKSGSPNR